MSHCLENTNKHQYSSVLSTLEKTRLHRAMLTHFRRLILLIFSNSPLKDTNIDAMNAFISINKKKKWKLIVWITLTTEPPLWGSQCKVCFQSALSKCWIWSEYHHFHRRHCMREVIDNSNRRTRRPELWSGVSVEADCGQGTCKANQWRPPSPSPSLPACLPAGVVPDLSLTLYNRWPSSASDTGMVLGLVYLGRSGSWWMINVLVKKFRTEFHPLLILLCVTCIARLQATSINTRWLFYRYFLIMECLFPVYH